MFQLYYLDKLVFVISFRGLNLGYSLLSAISCSIDVRVVCIHQQNKKKRTLTI